MKSKLEHWLKEENLTKIKDWMQDGCTLTDLATRMGISRATLRSWRAKHQEFGLRSDRRFQLIGGKAEIILHGGLNEHALALSNLYHLYITYPTWSRHNYLITRTNRCFDSVA